MILPRPLIHWVMDLSLQIAAMGAGWLAYISKTYPDGAAAAVDTIGEGTLVLDDD